MTCFCSTKSAISCSYKIQKSLCKILVELAWQFTCVSKLNFGSEISVRLYLFTLRIILYEFLSEGPIHSRSCEKWLIVVKLTCLFCHHVCILSFNSEIETNLMWLVLDSCLHLVLFYVTRDSSALIVFVFLLKTFLPGPEKLFLLKSKGKTHGGTVKIYFICMSKRRWKKKGG